MSAIKLKVLPRSVLKGKVRGTGRDGVDGTDGAVGPPGPTGPQGIQGVPGAPGLTGGIYTNIADFGAIGDGSHNDTAAINAAYASVKGQSATVYWPPGHYKCTDTIVVGDATGGAGAVTSFIGTYAPGGAGGPVTLNYQGPNDGRPAMLLARNKYNRMQGLRIQNDTGSRGITIGLMLGGSGAGASGTQTLAYTIDNCMVTGFHVGITDGNNGACSEILYLDCTLDNCDIGWVMNDFNSLDHQFIDLGLTSNAIGVDTGVISEMCVVGGSCSQNDIAFNISGNSQHSYIGNMRFEDGGACIHFNGANGRVVMESCLQLNAVAPNHYAVYGNAPGNLVLRNNYLDGQIIFATGSIPGQIMEITGNVLNRWDTVTGMPIFLPKDAGGGDFHNECRAIFQNNQDGGSPPVAIDDFVGQLGTYQDVGTGLVRPLFDSTIRRFTIDKTGGPAYFPTWQALSHVRHLGEGMVTVPSSANSVAATVGKNLRVQGTFVSSGSLSILFTRPMTVSASIGNVTVSVGGPFYQSDVGKALFIDHGADTGVDWRGQIYSFTSTTVVQPQGHPFGSPGGRFPQCTNKAATVGQDEPDANYMVIVSGNANETFWVTGISNTGFTVHSSNSSSTATVTCLIVR